jgi:tetratricopeptide (TPR) repeat protein
MAEWHIPEDLFERFLQVETSSEEARKVVRHLLSGCPQCSELAYRVTSESGLFASLEATGGAGWERAYEEVFTRALAWASEEEARLAVEKLRGWGQWAELAPMSPRLRFGRVESNPRFHNVGLYERLLEAARWYSRVEPREAVDVVRLAITVSERLDPGILGEQRIADLQAAAWAELGNARRIADDFEGARGAFHEAWRILESGSGDPMQEARLVSFEASYLKDVGEFESAESALEEALPLYREAGDTHGQGRILLQMGDAIGYVKPARGIAYIQKALALLDPVKEPRLQMYAQHDLALFLTENGQAEEALAVLERARPLFEQFWDDLTQLRLHWVEGKIADRLGNFEEAESILIQLWDEFRARDLSQEVVLVTIDLAQVLVKKGELARAAQLAVEGYSILRNWGLRQDALAAWVVFQEALSQGKLAGDLFERIGGYFRRHWFTAGRFEA